MKYTLLLALLVIGCSTDSTRDISQESDACRLPNALPSDDDPGAVAACIQVEVYDDTVAGVPPDRSDRIECNSSAHSFVCRGGYWYAGQCRVWTCGYTSALGLECHDEAGDNSFGICD